MANPWLASVGLQPAGPMGSQGGGQSIAQGIAQGAAGVAQAFQPQADRQQRTAAIAAANQLHAKAQDLLEQQDKAGTYDPDAFKAQFGAYAKPFQDRFARSDYGQIVENAASEAGLRAHGVLFSAKLAQDNKQEAGTLLQHQDVLSGQVRDGLAAGMSYDDPRLADARAMSAAHDRRLAQLGYSPSDLQGKALQREGQWRGVQLVTQAQRLLRAKGDRAGPAAAEQAIDDFRLHGPADVPPDVRDLAAAHAKSLLQGDISAAATRYAAAEKAQGEARQVAAYKAMDAVGAMVARGDDPSSYLASQKAALGPVGYAAAQVHLHGELRQQAQAKTQADVGLAMTLDPGHAEDIARARAGDLGPVVGPQVIARGHVEQAQAAAAEFKGRQDELRAQIETHLDQVSQNDLDNFHHQGLLPPATWAELTKAKAAAIGAITPDLGLSFAPQPAPSSPDAVVPAADPAGKVPGDYNQDHNSPSDDRRQAIERARARTPEGQLEAGNIDLHHRPVVHNADGSISTVRSIGVEMDGKTVLIPTVAADGSGILSNDAAVAQYRKTGQHLGVFKDEAAATAYAKGLHEEQAKEYASTGARAPSQGDGDGADDEDLPDQEADAGQGGAPVAAAAAQNSAADARAQAGNAPAAAQAQAPNATSVWLAAASGQRLPATPENAKRLDALIAAVNKGQAGGPPLNPNTPAGRANLARLILTTGNMPPSVASLLKGAVNSQDEHTLDAALDFYQRLRGGLKVEDGAKADDPSAGLRVLAGAVDDKTQAFYGRLGQLRGALGAGTADQAQTLREDIFGSDDSKTRRMLERLPQGWEDDVDQGMATELSTKLPPGKADGLTPDAFPDELKRTAHEVYKQQLVKFSGNRDLALADTADAILDTWGPSPISNRGDKWVKHPPEQMFPKGPGFATMPGDNWIAEQAIDIIKRVTAENPTKYDPNVPFTDGGMAFGRQPSTGDVHLRLTGGKLDPTNVLIDQSVDPTIVYGKKALSAVANEAADVAGAVRDAAGHALEQVTAGAAGGAAVPDDLGDAWRRGLIVLHPIDDGKKHGPGDPQATKPASEIWMRHSLDPSDLGQPLTGKDGQSVVFRPNPGDVDSPVLQDWLLAKQKVDDFAKAHGVPMLATQAVYQWQYQRLLNEDPRITYSKHVPVGTFPTWWQSLRDVIRTPKDTANVRAPGEAPGELPPPE